MHISESQYLAVHSFAAVVAAEVNRFAVKGNLGGYGGRSDAIGHFRLGGMLFVDLAAAYQCRNGSTNTKH